MIIVSFFSLMIRLPPRSTRTDTLFPYTTLFRSRDWPLARATAPRTIPLRVSASLREAFFFERGGCGPGLPLSRENRTRSASAAARASARRRRNRRGGRRARARRDRPRPIVRPATPRRLAPPPIPNRRRQRPRTRRARR